MRNNIRKLGIFLLGILILLILYLSYIQLKTGPELASHPKNYRLTEEMSKIHRGAILDNQGNILAETRWDDESGLRHYPLAEKTAHLLGYTSIKYGSAGLEGAYNRELLGLTSEGKFLNLMRQVTGEQPVGEDLVLTIDGELQHLAVKLLAQTGKPGAVVAVNPRTGAILTAASYPSFDPNNLETQWDSLVNNQQSPLLNRAFQGAYPPGSVIKPAIAVAALEADNQLATGKFNCPGYLEQNGVKLADNGVHGQVDLTQALVVSCNTTFGQLGVSLGKTKLETALGDFGFNSDFDLPIDVRPSTITNDDNIEKQELAEAAIGQGELLVSPLQMAMVASTIANNGILMQPYLVQEIIAPTGETTMQHQPQILKQVTTEDIARFVNQGMVGVVERGTGKTAAISGISVAGKTGTAENQQGQPHAWFIGFAPAHDPQIALAVIVENGGSGGTVAAPIAQQMILEALR
ncbi:penicillin-binding transpeptidase domain-containing protein [Peptococcaceae bacterium 1198_IL3148]